MIGRRYKVAHLITKLELGGAQQNTLYCTRHHDRRRFDVELIAGEGGLLDVEARSIPDARVTLLPDLRHPISPMADLRAVLRLRNHFRRAGIDLVHTHSSKAGLLGRVAAALAGVPAVLHTVHGWSFNDTQPPWRRRSFVALERMAAEVTDRLIVVSSAGRDTGLRRGIGRERQYELVRSGIEFDRFRSHGPARERVRRELGIEPGQRLVGTVACLKPQKAPADFVLAAAAAHARDSSLRFVVAGDGELRPALEKQIRELGLDGVVRLLGWRDDVSDLLQAMDLFLLTSLFEGLPRSVLQAMAAGVPVVATAVDGTPEVVQHGISGLLVSPGQPRAAAEAVIEMLSSEDLRQRCVVQAQRILDGEFDIRRMVDRLEGIYLSVLEQR